MSLAGIRAVLFDLDGTLVHSEAVAARAVEDVFGRFGMRLQPTLAELVTGKTWTAALQELEQHVSLPLPREEFLDLIIEEYRIRLKTEVHPVPGGVEAITQLAPRYKLGLVSGSYREEILFALNKLQVIHHFGLILGAEDYLNSKPEPDGYLKALQLFGLQPQEAIVFEDSEPGIRSAIAAGCKVVLVRHCSSIRAGSPWIKQVHAQIDTLEGVTPDWIQRNFN
ncbi:MAG: HAD family phosphatase [Bdellovibrionales bacterium]|nr:HAD family phosphatase [Bdellovibrionales bacterium]